MGQQLCQPENFLRAALLRPQIQVHRAAFHGQPGILPAEVDAGEGSQQGLEGILFRQNAGQLHPVQLVEIGQQGG